MTINLFVIGTGFLFSQGDIKNYQKDNMIWLGYYNRFKINEKWEINSDVQLRTKDWYKIPSQALIRSGLAYRINEKISVTAGLAHFRYYLTDFKTRGEWRPWQEMSLQDNIGIVKVFNRFRAEQRYNQKVLNNDPIDAYTFNWRFRYKLDLQFPIYKSAFRSLSLAFGNEVMINAGKASNSVFDQNRTQVGLNYEYSKNLTLQLAFTYIYQQINKNTLDKISVIRFNMIHTIFK